MHSSSGYHFLCFIGCHWLWYPSLVDLRWHLGHKLGELPKLCGIVYPSKILPGKICLFGYENPPGTEIFRFWNFKLFRWGTVPQPRDWQWQDATGIKGGCVSGDHLPLTIQFCFRIPSRSHAMGFPIFSEFVGWWLWLYQGWAASFTEFECLIWTRLVVAKRYMMWRSNMMQRSTKPENLLHGTIQYRILSIETMYVWYVFIICTFDIWYVRMFDMYTYVYEWIYVYLYIVEGVCTLKEGESTFAWIYTFIFPTVETKIPINHGWCAFPGAILHLASNPCRSDQHLGVYL